MVLVTVVVVGTVLVTVSVCGPDATITATTMPNPSASPDTMIRAIVVARPGAEPGESSTPLSLRAAAVLCDLIEGEGRSRGRLVERNAVLGVLIAKQRRWQASIRTLESRPSNEGGHMRRIASISAVILLALVLAPGAAASQREAVTIETQKPFGASPGTFTATGGISDSGTFVNTSFVFGGVPAPSFVTVHATQRFEARADHSPSVPISRRPRPRIQMSSPTRGPGQ
jgi:hypothetical protein